MGLALLGPYKALTVSHRPSNLVLGIFDRRTSDTTMANLNQLIYLVARQATDGAGTSYNQNTTTADSSTPEQCDAGNKFDGRLGVRISAIFVILIGSLFGMSTRDFVFIE